MSVFGDFVKLRREELGLDQEGLARELGVHQQTVSKWERAKTVPNPQRIRQLAEVLRVDLSDLMKFAGYLPASGPEEEQAQDPFHQVLDQVSHLTNDQRSFSSTKPGRNTGSASGSVWNTPVDVVGAGLAVTFHPSYPYRG